MSGGEGASSGLHMMQRPRRVCHMAGVISALALAGHASAFLITPKPLDQSVAASGWAAAGKPRSRGVMHSLIINPKRAGVKEVGIEDIKAKRASLQPPPGLAGSILVTGTIEEEVYTLLNEQRVWSRITALTPDPQLARKRLTSRQTRYSGLLDLLAVQQGDPEDLAAVEETVQAHKYTAWLDIHTDADVIKLLAKAKLVVSSGVKFFVTTVSLTMDQIEQSPEFDLDPVAQVLRDAGVSFRFLVTGPVITAPATGYVRLNDTAGLLPNATITRGDLSRIATEFFLVTEKANATLIYAYQGDDTVEGYLRNLREQGMNYKAEIHDQLQGGYYTYKDRVAAYVQAEKEKALGIVKGAKKDSELYASYRVNVTTASINTGFDKKRRTLVGMVKKIVDTLLEEEYDDMYYSMRMKDDLELYKKANWQRAVQLVLGLLFQNEEKPKVAQKMTGFQDPYLGPQWHVIKGNAAAIIKIKELYDEIGDRLTKEDWEKYDMIEGDFVGDEEAVMAMKIEEKTKRNKNYLKETLSAPPRKKASLVLDNDDIGSYREAVKALNGANGNTLLGASASTPNAGSLPSPAAAKTDDKRSLVVEVNPQEEKEKETVDA